MSFSCKDDFYIKYIFSGKRTSINAHEGEFKEKEDEIRAGRSQT
jgi:hypothetical protein